MLVGEIPFNFTRVNAEDAAGSVTCQHDPQLFKGRRDPARRARGPGCRTP